MIFNMVSMKLICIGIICIILKCASIHAQLLIPTRELRVEKFQQCPNSENLPVVLKDIVITQSGRNVIVLSAKQIVKELVGTHPLEMNIELHKCVSKEEVSSCEYYTRIKLKDCCDLASIYSNFMKSSNHTKCPVKVGEYYYDKARVDLRDLQFLPLFDSYWKMKTSVSEEKRRVSCVWLEFSLKKSVKKIRT